MLPPGVSLGVFSLRERHNATYNEHMPMNELHTAICNQLAHGKLHVNRPPRQGPNAAHPFCLPATLDVGTDTKWGLEPQILRWQTSTIRITPQRLAISGPNLCPVKGASWFSILCQIETDLWALASFLIIECANLYQLTTYIWTSINYVQSPNLLKP